MPTSTPPGRQRMVSGERLGSWISLNSSTRGCGVLRLCVNFSEAVKTTNKNTEKIIPEMVTDGLVTRFETVISRRINVMILKPKEISTTRNLKLIKTRNSREPVSVKR